MINFEETELRLALPGNDHAKPSAGKRGFSETASVDLKLNLSSNTHLPSSTSLPSDTPIETTPPPPPPANDPAKPPAKAQVVGWPPVRSLRKKIVNVQRRKKEEGEGGVALVKVSMDGAPYLRKVDLKLYKSYQELSDALAKMLSSFTIGNCMNETKFIDLFNASHYVPTYQDKDGDWMLVGDVPWEMFVQSCNRLRIIKPSEAIALAPRALQKCKNRS